MLLTEIRITIENDLPDSELVKISEFVQQLAENFADNTIDAVKVEFGKDLVLTVSQ